MGLSIVYNKYNFIINLNEKNRDFLKKFNIRKLLCNTMEKVTFLWKYLYKSNLKKIKYFKEFSCIFIIL